MKRAAGNVVLLIASFTFALVGAELLLRACDVSHAIFLQPDRLTGWAHIPGAEGWWTSEGRSYVRINARGWRDKDRPFRKPAGVTRIAILGDSYMEAVPVAEDSALPALLERHLNRILPGRYEVLNFGVAGFGTAQELLVLQHYALEYEPDAVILAFTTYNDVSDNSHALKRGTDLPFFTLVGQRLVLDTSFLTSPRYRSATSWRGNTLRFLAEHSRVVQLLRHAKVALYAARAMAQGERRDSSSSVFRELSVQYEVYLNPPPDSVWADAWKVTERLVARIHSECGARNIPFYLLTLSNPPQVTPDSARLRAFAAHLGVRDLLQPERRLAILADHEGFDMLALAPLLSAQAIAKHEFYHGFGELLGRGHWNEAGHREGARLLSAWLAERLPRDVRSHWGVQTGAAGSRNQPGLVTGK